MSRRMHLTGFMAHCPAPHTQMSWIHPQEKMPYVWHEPEYWQTIARTLERGKFDMFFFADQWAGYEAYQESLEPTIKYAVQYPVHDPVVLIPALAAVTEKLGFAVTMSVTYYPPFLLARKLSSLDHVTKGRIGWNIVTSFHESEARNFGLETMIPRDERYDRADEYMEVCHQLWNSWEPDAVCMDMQRGIFADPAKVHHINFEGQWFQCRGPSMVIPSPQGRPVLIQAGASERGRDFAVKHAECVFGVQLTAETTRLFRDDLYARMKQYGRDPQDLQIIWGVIPIVGKTEAEARAKEETALKKVPLEVGLTILSGHLNYDLSRFDLDEPLADLQVPGIQGVLDMFRMPDGTRPTLRTAAMQHGGGVSMPHLVGTPEQVADQLAYLHQEGGGSGFQFSPAYYAPEYFEDIVDLLIPVLQERGLFRHEYAGAMLRDHLREA